MNTFTSSSKVEKEDSVRLVEELRFVVYQGQYFWIDQDSPNDGKDSVALRGARKIFIVRRPSASEITFSSIHNQPRT